jgi:5-methylthioadenosine/S-adenosylhomocysteine deaminase
MVRGGVAVTGGSDPDVIADAVVLIEDGEIAWLGPTASWAGPDPDARLVDARDCLITPGLIDAHNHPIHFLSKGIADDRELSERSYERIWPYEAALTDGEAYVSALGTFAEMLCHGTTCFADPGSLYPDAVARAAAEIGIRGVISREAFDVPDPQAPSSLVETTEEVLERGRATVEALNGAAGGRIRGWLSLVRPVSVSDELCRRTAAMAAELGVGIHGHMVVSRTTNPRTQEVVGVGSAVERYSALGVLDVPLVLAHLGALSDDEIDTLASREVAAVHCPSASMLGGFGVIAHGTFPEMVQRGLTVALGSDAAAISRFLDMVRVAYLAACAHKDARIDPTIMGADVAFAMLTTGAARALRWDDRIGRLAVGMAADLAIFATDGLAFHPRPLSNPVRDLIYGASGSAVRTVIVDGEVVLEDGLPVRVDLDALRRNTATAADDVLTRIGVQTV